MKLVIIGGVAGGASAAARARRLAESAEIVLVERGPDVSYANCGLPYYIGGEIKERSKLLVVSPERLRKWFHIDVRTRTEAIAIDRERKEIRLRDLEQGTEYCETYDRLILAPGAAPVRPPLPGIDLPGVFTLRNLPDTDRIKAAFDSGASSVVILGAGFIGLELAETLKHRGIAVTVVELAKQILPPFDPEMTTPLLQTLAEQGVRVILGQGAQRIEASSGGLRVLLSSGEAVSADVVVLGVGVRPENKLAVEAGLPVGPRGGIVVDAYLRTADPTIFAVGDAIEVSDVISGERVQVPLAGPANRQGRIAAENALGGEVRYRGTQGTAILRLFNRTGAVTGSSEKALQRSGKPYQKVYIHPMNHAGYYPGAEGMTLKLLFDPESGRILGAQGVGGAGVDKRIDILAVAIQAKLTVYDLEEMELAYSPQYGSAKDPINMLGFVAAGLLRGDHPQLDIEAILQHKEGDPLLLDVRTAEEYAAGHIPGARNIPLDQLRERFAELPENRVIAAYCQVGQRGYLATRILVQKGFRAANVSGGYRTYLLYHPQ